jgi:hypothetical protein
MTRKNDGSRVARTKRARAKAAESTNVPSFPEIIARNSQCRLCGLVDSNPDLLRHVHDSFLAGKGVRALETETMEPLQSMGETAMNVKCFARHFKAHVSFADMKPVFAPAVVPMPVPAPKVVEDEEESLEAAAYFDMRNLITKLRARMETIDQSTAFVDDKGKVNSYGLQLWLKFVDSFRAALEAMNRIKNNDRLTRAILQAHAKRQTQIVSAQLISRFETTLAKVRRGDPDALADLESFALTEAKNIVLEGARTAVEESCEVYRLH